MRIILTLPEFSLSGERLMMMFNSYNPQGGTYYKVGLQEDLSDDATFVEVKAARSVRVPVGSRFSVAVW